MPPLREALGWVFQMAASLFWLVSVFVYGSFETGDVMQLLAAACWAVANVLALPDVAEALRPKVKGKDVPLDSV